MNVYDHAMKIEKEGELYYRELSNISPNHGIKTLFNILADEEIRHYNVIKDMKNNSDINMSDLNTKLDEKTIYSTLSKQHNTVNISDDEIEFYEIAIKNEDNLEKYYLEKAEELEDDAFKAIFIKLAHEESKHKHFLQNIVDTIRKIKKNKVLHC